MDNGNLMEWVTQLFIPTPIGDDGHSLPQALAEMAQNHRVNHSTYKGLLMFLAFSSRQGKFCMSISSMAIHTGLDAKTVRKCLSLAETVGHVRPTEEYGMGVQLIPEYVFCPGDCSAAPWVPANKRSPVQLRLIPGGIG